MADPIRINNFFSSFDTESVINQLTAARQTAITRLDIQASAASAKKTTLSTLQARFSSLLGKLGSLTSTTSVSTKSALVTGSGVSAAATPASAIGSFTVGVTKLATGTSVLGSAVTAPINATAPLELSNFGTVPTNGTFTVGTATGGFATIKVGSTALNATDLLGAGNFTTAVTAGTITLATATGGTDTFTVDPATQSMQDMVDAINGSAIGVTASITNDANGHPNILTLTSTQGAITIGDSADTSNFLTATNLVGAGGTGTVASTAAFTRQMSLNDVIGEINASGVGVTASAVNDANGRANILSLTSSQGALSLGNVNDTSNFLRATNLLASPGGTTRTSTLGMARINQNAKLSDTPFFGGAPASGPQSFTINGTSISYDAAVDSLADVINRINSSTAGVTARYDPVGDTVKLTQAKTGSLSVTLADTGGGDLLARLGLAGATETLGQNAEYSIDGGPAQFSATNTLSGPGGVTLTLTALTTPGTPATVTVNRDTSAALSAINGFISDFNSTMTAIDAATKADKAKPGSLSGDATLRQLKASMRAIVTSPGVGITGNLKSLGDLGLSFGAVGSAPGSTNTLQLNEATFLDKLNNDPSSVQNVLSTFVLTPALDLGGTGSVASMTGTYAGAQAGSYLITDDGTGLLTATFTPINGGPPSTTQATVTAGSTTTSLIPGMTLTIGGTLQAGTHKVTVSATGESSLNRLKALVDSQGGVGGILQKRQDTYSKVISDLNDRMDSAQKRIDVEMAQWRKKFAAMEQANAKYQSIASGLTALQAQISNTKSN
ncbi:hypothetical protein AYO38_11620 [bacterium SCGC AG-212-C10]|nr:hypothetical protein AYO38_11620 [bacterium SCGC AG-212-C10]